MFGLQIAFLYMWKSMLFIQCIFIMAAYWEQHWNTISHFAVNEGKKAFQHEVCYLLENRAVQIILSILSRKAFLVNVLFASQTQLLKILL